MTTNARAAGPDAGSGRGRYLLGGATALLRQVAGRIAAGEFGDIGCRPVGSGPDALAIEADIATLTRLRADHPALVIEPDDTLPEPRPAWPPGIG